jgi:hypothetical protein
MNAEPVAVLDGLLRWVAWRNEMRNGKLTKVPHDPVRGGFARANNPTTWGSKNDAESLARRIVNGAGGGIGIVLGDMGDGRALGGVDLDSCREGNGKFLPWAAEVAQRLKSYCEVSPSRTGGKVFFLYDPADLPALRAMMGSDWGKSWKLPSGGEHPPGIELHLGNRYFTVTGERLNLGPIELRPVPLDTLRWIIQKAGPALVTKPVQKTPRAPKSALPEPVQDAAGPSARIEAGAQHATLAKRWAGDWEGLNDASQSGKAMALGSAMVRAGFNFADMCTGLAMHPDTAAWATSKGADSGNRELHRIFEKAEASRDNRPELLVQSANLPATAHELRVLFAASGRLFDRGGVPVLLRDPADGGLPVARRLTTNMVVTLAHDFCRPVRLNAENQRTGMTLPDRVAKIYLDLPDWGLRPLAGITSAPLLQADASIIGGKGYDPRLQTWCVSVPHLMVPERPTKPEAEAALALLRETFRTFPFHDSPFVERAGLAVVDTSKPANIAEASFLAGLMTAVTRPSLWTAPGLLVTAPEVTGSGAGKGLLVRAICAIAYGVRPAPFTAGHNRDELDKRLVAELIEAGPVIFLDNVNGTVFRSDTLASVMTERPARVRVMGKSENVPLNCAGLIALTGNGLSVSEDLARRFLSIQLEPQCEDAENRPFEGGFLEGIFARRAELLAAVLTIWRWGRQSELKPGLALNSYETWAQWCRDPLLALGCADPVERVRQVKQADPKRRSMAELFDRWRQHHDLAPVKVAELAPEVIDVFDPHGRSRQYRTTRLHGMVGTRIGGFVLTHQAAAGKWGAGTFALRPATAESANPAAPVGPSLAPPMSPVPEVTAAAGSCEGAR